MSFYLDFTEEDMIFVATLSEEHKNRKTDKIKKRFLKQTDNQEIAESSKPIN